jgi:hypothetical protein
MKTKLSILQWDLEFDKEDTVKAYVDLTYYCKCSYCRNFLATYRILPSIYFEILHNLGIDPVKPAEIIEYCKNKDGTHLYQWWYHVVGNLLNKCETSIKFTEQVDILIRNRDDLVPKDFPNPIIQIDFFASLPWVLEEES